MKLTSEEERGRMENQYILLLVAVLTTFKMASASIHRLEWTIEGVESVNSMIEVSPGDKLILRCVEGTFSSIDLVNRYQYDACNKHAGQGHHSQQTHHCSFGSYDITFQIKPPHFISGTTTYLTSFSNGSDAGYPESEDYSSNECTRGLKLALRIGVSNCSMPELTNGLFLSQYSGGRPGDVLFFQCPSPFRPTERTGSVCTPQGAWNPPVKCTRHCLILPPPANSTFLNNATSSPGSVIAIQCNHGFTPSSPFHSTCSPSGDWIPTYINYRCTKAEVNVSMRMMEGFHHYVCTNDSLTFACRVQSNTRRLHLVWTVRIPGRPVKTMTMHRSRQIERSSDHSMNSSVTHYNPRTHTMSSNLHIRMPSVNSHYDSRAYVMCGVRDVTTRSHQLRYHPAPESPANLTGKMTNWRADRVTTTLTWYQRSRSHNTRNYTIRFQPRWGPFILYYHNAQNSHTVRRFTCTMRVGMEYKVTVTPHNCRGKGPSSNITLCTCPAPDPPINGTMSHRSWAEPFKTSRLICPPGSQPSRNSRVIKCTLNATWDHSSEGFYCEKEQVSVGFTQDTYSVYEERGFVIVTVKISASNLITRSASVSFHTTPGTAKAPSDFIDPGYVSIRFNQQITYRHVKIAIVNDRTMENIKYFYCHLRTSDHAVTIVRRLAKVMIQDYDRKNCEPPIPPLNGRLGNYSAAQNPSHHGDIVTFLCNNHFAVLTSVCRDGQWQPPPHEQDCASPTVSNVPYEHTVQLRQSGTSTLNNPFIIAILIVIVILVILLLALFIFLIVCYRKINNTARMQRRRRKRKANCAPDMDNREWSYSHTRRMVEESSEDKNSTSQNTKLDPQKDHLNPKPTKSGGRSAGSSYKAPSSGKEGRATQKRGKKCATLLKKEVFSSCCSCLDFNID